MDAPPPMLSHYRAEASGLEDFRIYEWMRPRVTDAIWCHAIALPPGEVAHLYHAAGSSTRPSELDEPLVAYSGSGRTMEERIRVIGPGPVAPDEFPHGAHEFLVHLGDDAPARLQPGPVTAMTLLPLWRLFVSLRLGRPQDEAQALMRDLAAQARQRINAQTLPGKAAAELGADLHATLSTEELAERLGYSKSHLCHAFKQAFGVTITQFRRVLRMDRACALVWTTMRPLGEIAVNVGYTDQSHMTRELVQLLGHAPASFRQLAPCAGNPRILAFLTQKKPRPTGEA